LAAPVNKEWQVVSDEAESEDPHKSRSADLRRVGGLAVALLVLAASTASISLDSSRATLCGFSRPTGAMTLVRVGHTATLLQSGKVLVAGGWTDSADSPVTSSAELYDPTTGTWTATGSMKYGRGDHAAVLLRSGEVLVAGGDAPAEDATTSVPLLRTIGTAEVYHPDSGTWTETSRMPVAGRLLSAILLQSGKVFVAPWRSGTNGLDLSAELYEPVSKSWSVIGGLIQPFGSATLLASGKVLVVSGSSEAAQLYDPATGAWRGIGMNTTIRDEHTATLLPSGKVLVVGGIYLDTQLSTAEIYDPATEMWTPTSRMTTRHREGTDATLLPFGKVLVAGGAAAYPGPRALDSVELFDPASARWTVSGVMANARSFFTATPLHSGAVLFAGGGGPTGGTSSAEIYSATCYAR
jgi:Kelch motif protein/galactose oxidase-like protein